MKVGTLTFPGSPSHGASLQMYALYSALKHMGTDVEVINYVSDKVNHRKRPPKGWKDIIAGLFLKDTDSAFKKFESQISFSQRTPVSTTDDLKKHIGNYDRIIVGSDQVWNPVVTGNDMNFYLEFCDDDQKKASYAPSFGVEQVMQDDREQIARLLSKITYLSAREERGQELIFELTGRDVPVVLDPTFLVDREEWRSLKKNSGAKGDYVFVYTIKPSPKLYLTARAFSEKYGYKVVTISGGLHGVLDKFNPKKNTVSGTGPAEFIDLIDNAKYIFTNSFHGTAMSIILNKNFHVEFSSDTNTRLVSLINHFNLHSNIIDCGNFDYALRQINYVEVNRILLEKKKESLAYLEGIVG